MSIRCVSCTHLNVVGPQPIIFRPKDGAGFRSQMAFHVGHGQSDAVFGRDYRGQRLRQDIGPAT